MIEHCPRDFTWYQVEPELRSAWDVADLLLAGEEPTIEQMGRRVGVVFARMVRERRVANRRGAKLQWREFRHCVRVVTKYGEMEPSIREMYWRQAYCALESSIKFRQAAKSTQ